MIRLPAGTLKFLLLDHKAIERNAQRVRAAAPAAVVYHVQEDGTTVRHVGHAVATSGHVELSYAPRGYVVTRHRDKHRAAYSTTSEVLITETAEESLSDVETEQTPPTTEPKAPTTKAKKTK